MLKMVSEMIFGSQQIQPPCDDTITIAIAETVTAGSLINILYSKPEKMQILRGGIVICDSLSEGNALGIDVNYIKQNGFVNPFIVAEMSQSVARLFNTRIGFSVSGYLTRHMMGDKQKDPCALICLWDTMYGTETIYEMKIKYDPTLSEDLQRAEAQVRIAIESEKYIDQYIKKIQKEQDSIV
jgi:nicotinamide mononucleotide (NMN) deamidase PncC